MTLQRAVQDELAGQKGWRVEMALALASEVDAKGSASAAKELRSLLAELGADVSTGKQPKETPASDFERRLREREAKAARRTATG